MTRLAFLAIGILIGIAFARVLCKRKPQPERPCPEYKVYDEEKVQELETIAKARRLSR